MAQYFRAVFRLAAAEKSHLNFKLLGLDLRSKHLGHQVNYFVGVKFFAHLLVVPPLDLVHVEQVIYVIQQQLRLKVDQHDVPIDHWRVHSAIVITLM